jgi:UDP:flavonoid glycosyltransferase YjiC (YdhE family)
MGHDGTAEAIEGALQLCRLRAVIASGGRTPGCLLVDGARRTAVAGEVPHTWLFPRTTAVVHHGGAGTTAEGVRAGVPFIIFPVAADQYFWGERIARLGAGPRPLSRGSLTPRAVAGLFVQAAKDPRMRERARNLGTRVRAERGVATAVDALLPLIDTTARSPRGFFPLSSRE